MKPRIAAKLTVDRAKAKAKITASPTERAAALLSALRPVVARHVPLLRRSDDLHRDFARFFAAVLPVWLSYYMAMDGLLRDRIDLEQATFYGVPRIATGWLIRLLSDRPACRILSDFTRRHLTRALRLLSHQLEPPDDPLGMVLLTIGQDTDSDSDPVDPITMSLAFELEGVVSDFASHVFFDLPPTPVTEEQRKVARHERLANYQHVAKLQGIQASFSAVCRRAGVKERIGHGSGADWLNGKLKDDAKVSLLIEDVISFKSK